MIKIFYILGALSVTALGLIYVAALLFGGEY